MTSSHARLPGPLVLHTQSQSADTTMIAHSLYSSSTLPSVKARVAGLNARRSNAVTCRLGKAEIVGELADRLKTSKVAAADALNALVDIIAAEVTAGQKVTIVGFGTWQRRERKARAGRNPQTGAPLQIPACFTPGFSAGKAFKDRVNGRVSEEKPPKVPKAKAAPKPKAAKAADPAKPATKPAVAKAAAATPAAPKPKTVDVAAKPAAAAPKTKPASTPKK